MRFDEENKKSRDYLLFLLKIEGKACYLSTIYVHRAIISRQSEAPLQMKRALHMASEGDAYARLVFYVAIGWSSLPFSGC